MVFKAEEEPSAKNWTAPVGIVAPDAVSVTVAVNVAPPPATGVALTAVDVSSLVPPSQGVELGVSVHDAAATNALNAEIGSRTITRDGVAKTTSRV